MFSLSTWLLVAILVIASAHFIFHLSRATILADLKAAIAALKAEIAKLRNKSPKA
jgi:cell division protein FtsB